MTLNQRGILRVSTTGILHGFGSCRYKWVSNLSDAERALARNGGTVLVPVICPKQSQTDYKVVIAYRRPSGGWHYGHRNWYGGTL